MDSMQHWGSPLSPILYLFYNATILEENSEEENTLTNGYIDDIGILTWSKSTEENCRKLDKIHQRMEGWAARAASVFAPNKYALIHFTSERAPKKETEREIVLHLKNGNTQTIEPSTKERYLAVMEMDGMWIDPHPHPPKSTKPKWMWMDVDGSEWISIFIHLPKCAWFPRWFRKHV